MQTKTPLVTIIIPTFRRPRLLKRAVNSALRQTFTDFQICVYDNASGDNTGEVMAEFTRQDRRIKYHCHSENIGAGANFSFGLARVDTRYFSFLSDDDLLLPSFLETAMRGFEQWPDAAFSAGSVIIMNEKGKVLNVPLHHWEREGVFFPSAGLLKTIGGNAPIWTGMLFRQDAAKLIGGLPLGSWVMDMDFVSRLASRFPYVVSKKPCAIYVAHESSGSAGMRLSNYWPSCLNGIKAIAEDSMVLKELRDKFVLMQRLYVSKVIFLIGVRSLEFGNVETARTVAGILRSSFKQNARANFLLLMAGKGTIGKILRNVFVKLLKGRRKFRALVNPESELQRQYGSFAGELADS